jgi:hypothetical protein
VITYSVSLECPKCHWIFDAASPDKCHMFASVEAPQKNEVTSDIILESHVCRNPKCQKIFSIYWFDSKMHIKRI